MPRRTAAACRRIVRNGQGVRIVALEGNLIDLSIGDMFRLLASGRKTGTLYLQRAGSHGKVCFKDGRIFFAATDQHSESFARRLVKSGLISEKQLRQALGLQKIQKKEKAGRRLAQILVDEGYLDGRVLESFVQEQVHEALFDLFRWEEGELRFEPDDISDADDIGISVSVEDAISEASRRLELWGRIKQKIPSMDAVFVMAAGPGDKSMEIHLKPREWLMLCYLHGGRSVRELVELTGYDDFETAKTLYGMYAAGLIERVETSVGAS